MCVKCLALCQASGKRSVNISSFFFFHYDYESLLGGVSLASDTCDSTTNFIEGIDHTSVSLLRYKWKV